MEINGENTKLMTNNNGMTTDIQIQNPFLTAQSTQIKLIISKILFIIILGHCLTTYTVSVRTFTTYPGRGAVYRHTRVGTHRYDIPGSGRSLTTYPGHPRTSKEPETLLMKCKASNT